MRTTTRCSRLRAGARGYLLKEASAEDIRRAARTVAHGEAIFGPRVADRVISFFSALSGSRGPTPLPQLTNREHEILSLVAAGCGNATIARRLVLSDKTVRNHISAMLSKLRAATRAEAVARARDAGMGSNSTPEQRTRHSAPLARTGPDIDRQRLAGILHVVRVRVRGARFTGVRLWVHDRSPTP